MKTAIFAGGCFWCMEAAFKSIEGVEDIKPGYSGGELKNPKYEEVCSGTTGHYEAIQITYDEKKIPFKQLVDFFVRQIDPTDPDGQFVDRGSQYRTAIFVENKEEKKTAEEALKELQKSFDKPIVTEILDKKEFYEAEKYHHNYSEKNKFQYKIYEQGTGRKGFLKKIWN